MIDRRETLKDSGVGAMSAKGGFTGLELFESGGGAGGEGVGRRAGETGREVEVVEVGTGR